MHLLNNQHLELCPGSIYIVTPLDFHRVYANCGDTMDIYHIQLGCSVLGAELMQRITQDQAMLSQGIHVCLSDNARQLVQPALEQLLSEFFRQRSDSVMLMRSCLERLCILILREAELSARPGNFPCPQPEMETPKPEETNAAHPINCAVQYVHYNFRNPITLAEAARSVHLSCNYFGELFRANVGMSFNKYLRKCRLEYARRLLLETRMDVVEVANESGFHTPSYFTDVFRRQYGITPTEFRRSYSKKVEESE